jgi:hypothetical protein
LANWRTSLFSTTPGRDFGWYDQGWEASFAIEIGFPLPIVRQMIAEKRCDIEIGSLGFDYHGEMARQADFVLLELSPPDAHGYCSFGASCWTKLTELRGAKFVIAEINKNLLRTYGENHVHVSEIDLFVEHTPSGKTPGGTIYWPQERRTRPGNSHCRLSHTSSTMEIPFRSASARPQNGAPAWIPLRQTGPGCILKPPPRVSLNEREALSPVAQELLNGKQFAPPAARYCGNMQWVTMNPAFELIRPNSSWMSVTSARTIT